MGKDGKSKLGGVDGEDGKGSTAGGRGGACAMAWG